MTEKQFLLELESALSSLPQEERMDILQDIQEYFANGQIDGKTDSEIAVELGTPEAIARELNESFNYQQTNVAPTTFELTEDQFDTIDIQIENGILHLSPSKDGKMHADVINRSYRQQWVVDITNRTLVILLKEERKWGLFSFTGSLKSPTLNVELPTKRYDKILISSDHGRITGSALQCAELQVMTDNGRIDFSQINADDAEFQSGNGEISLKSILANELRAETDNGQVKIQNVQTQKLDVRSDNGAIIMRKVEGNIRAKTDNGRIHLLTNTLDRNIKLETGSGSIVLDAQNKPKNTTIQAEVDWGTISVFGSQNTNNVFGNGRHSVDLRSDYGDITVQLIE